MRYSHENAFFFLLCEVQQPSQPKQKSYLAGLFGDVIQAESEHFSSGSDDKLADVVTYHQRAQATKAGLFKLFQVHV